VNSTAIEDIERQIDHTRSELERTIRALRVELSPRHRVEVAWKSAKARTARSLRTGADWAVGNPVPAGAVVVILMAAAIVIGIQRRQR
jgi:Protein of unknown function (DUF3618)